MIKFAVIGDPIEQSKSPELHDVFFNQMKFEAITEKVHCPKEDLSNTIDKLKKGEWSGMNVTIPHKETVMAFMDSLDIEAKAAGAVNCIVKINGKLEGRNTDRPGFKMMLTKNQIDPSNSNCLVIGAGGAGKTATGILSEMNAEKIFVWSRKEQNAHDLAGIMNYPQSNISVCSDKELSVRAKNADIIVNCTPLGMGSLIGRSPLEPNVYSSRQTVIDCIYNPLKTKMLLDAEKSGAKICTGMDMFIYQAMYALKAWLPEINWSQLDIDHARQFLTQIVSENS